MVPVRSPGLYVSLGVVLIFVLTTYLASSIRGEDPPSVSVVQEPKVSQLPSGFALVGNEERNTEDSTKENQPKNEAESPTVDTGNDERTRAERSGLEEYPSGTARVPSSATVFASASASASPASTGSASPSVTATPPTRVRPDPAAREQPGERDMAAPGGPRARVSGSQSLYETQAGPVDATQLGDRVPNKVKKAVDSAW